MSKPRKSILDKSFPYTPAVNTNVKDTFERVKREQQEQAKRDRAIQDEARSKTIAWRKR